MRKCSQVNPSNFRNTSFVASACGGKPPGHAMTGSAGSGAGGCNYNAVPGQGSRSCPIFSNAVGSDQQGREAACIAALNGSLTAPPPGPGARLHKEGAGEERCRGRAGVCTAVRSHHAQPNTLPRCAGSAEYRGVINKLLEVREVGAHSGGRPASWRCPVTNMVCTGESYGAAAELSRAFGTNGASVSDNS